MFLLKQTLRIISIFINYSKLVEFKECCSISPPPSQKRKEQCNGGFFLSDKLYFAYNLWVDYVNF